MNWEARRDYWHELARVGTDALAVFGWLYWCGADTSGLFKQSPDKIALDLAMPNRKRAIAALAKLSKTDDEAAPALGELAPIVTYDFKHFIGYVHGWNLPHAPTAPRGAGDVQARIKYAKRKPDCPAVRLCLAELGHNEDRWDESYPEFPLVALYRTIFGNTGAIMPSAAALRDGSALRQRLTEAWTKTDRPPLNQRAFSLQEWEVHFRVVALNLTPDGMFYARSTSMKCTLDWLVLDSTIAAARSKGPEDRRQKAFAS